MNFPKCHISIALLLCSIRVAERHPIPSPGGKAAHVGLDHHGVDRGAEIVASSQVCRAHECVLLIAAKVGEVGRGAAVGGGAIGAHLECKTLPETDASGVTIGRFRCQVEEA